MVHIDDATDTADVNLARGYQTLDADKAYQYVRFVDADKNAFSRTQRQERVFKTTIEFSGRHLYYFPHVACVAPLEPL